MSDQPGEWLTIQETMAVLGVGRTRLWQLTRDAQLVAHQRGPDRKMRYYARRDVERLANDYRPAFSRRLVHPEVG